MIRTVVVGPLAPAAPAAPPGAAAGRSVRVAAAVAALVAVVAAWAGIGVRATYGGQVAVDEPEYLLTAVSLWEDRSLDVSDELRERRWLASHDRAELPQQVQPRPDGSALSPHDPLLPLLLAAPVGLTALAGVPAWVAAKVVLGIVAGALAACVVVLAVRRFGVPPWVAAIGTSLAAASPPLAVYGQQVYPELPAAFAVVVGVGALTGPLRARAVVLLGSAVTVLPWLGVKYAPVAAVLALCAVGTLGRARRWAAAGWLVVGLAASATAYLALHRLLYGGWTAYAAGDHFSSTGELSVVGVAPDYLGRSVRLVGLLTDRDFGLLVWQPAWLLLLPALGALLVLRPRGWAVLLSVVAVGWGSATWLALTMHGFWWPGRQLVVVLPVALVVVLWWAARLPVAWRWTAAALGAAGVVTYGWLVVDGLAGRLTWVLGPERVGDPLVQAARLVLPDYRAPGFWPLHVAWAAVLVGSAAAGAWLAGRERAAARRAAVP